jgi:hypothetical protein
VKPCLINRRESVLANAYNYSSNKRVLLKNNLLLKVTPDLAKSQHARIGNIIYNTSFKSSKIAEVVRYSISSVYIINKNHCYCNFTKAPLNSVKRPKSVIPLFYYL